MPPAAAHPRTAHAHDHSHGHDHAHDRGHNDGHGEAHRHSHSHTHSHGAGHLHPAAKPAPSLLRLSAWQRLGIVLPLAVLLWAATLWVIQGGAS